MKFTDEPFDPQAFRRQLDADPAMKRCFAAAVHGFRDVADVEACYGIAPEDAGGAGHAPTVEASARGGGGAPFSSAPPPPSSDQAFEELYRQYAAQTGGDAPSLDQGQLSAIPQEELAQLEARAAWAPDVVYERYFGEPPLTPDEEPAYASDEDALYARLT